MFLERDIGPNSLRIVAIDSATTSDAVPDDGEDVVDPSAVRNYDIGRQERIVRGRMPTLEIINERFARNLRIALYNFMRRNAEISVGPIRVQKYSEFIRNLVVPTNLNMIQMKLLPVQHLFCTQQKITRAYQIIHPIRCQYL